MVITFGLVNVVFEKQNLIFMKKYPPQYFT